MQKCQRGNRGVGGWGMGDTCIQYESSGLVWWRREGEEIAAANWPLLMWQVGRTWCGGAGHGVSCGVLSASLLLPALPVLRLRLAERMNAFLLNSCSRGFVYTLYLTLPIISVLNSKTLGLALLLLLWYSPALES